MSAKESPRQGLPWRRRLVVLLLVIVAGSIALRVQHRRRAEHRPRPSPAPSLVTGREPEAAPEQPSTTEKVLPFVTEGGLAMLLGLALGLATRAVAKLFVFLLVLGFVVLQYLAVKGILTVDWKALGDFVLNIPASTGLSMIVQHKLPAAGSLVLGYLLGLKR